jgi:fido (protein-threonine AMPylation protein)
LAADQVAIAMTELESEMQQLWSGRPGRDDPWRDAAFQTLARLTARFFAIHPFMDGNGHIWRLTLPTLAARLGLTARPEWTAHRRPYGPEFSLALQWHADHPSILTDQLRRWFRPDETQ